MDPEFVNNAPEHLQQAREELQNAKELADEPSHETDLLKDIQSDIYELEEQLRGICFV